MARLGASARTRLRLYLWSTRPHVCHLCGRPIASLAEAEADHREAYADDRSRWQGSADDYELAHGTRSASKCNQRRGKIPLDRWAATRPVDNLALFAGPDF